MRRLPWAERGSRADDDVMVTELYRQIPAPPLAYVPRLTAGDRQLAEDVVQEAMIRAWRQADRLDLTEPSLMPWLATVAPRSSSTIRAAGAPGRPRRTTCSTVSPPATRPITCSGRMVVTAALRTLSPADREVLTEQPSCVASRTVNEAAEVRGIPVGTVKSRDFFYALRRSAWSWPNGGVSVRSA